MSSKINFLNILKDHKSTLVDQNTSKPGGDDIFYFVIVPIFLPIILVLGFQFDFDNYLDLRRTLVSSLAIFVGLLFNALVLLINIAKNGDTIGIRKKVIQHLIANISFNIITALFAVLLILLRFLNFPTFLEVEKFIPTTKQLFDIMSLVLLISFFITFLMIMKRTYLIINTEINKNA